MMRMFSKTKGKKSFSNEKRYVWTGPVLHSHTFHLARSYVERHKNTGFVKHSVALTFVNVGVG